AVLPRRGGPRHARNARPGAPRGDGRRSPRAAPDGCRPPGRGRPRRLRDPRRPVLRAAHVPPRRPARRPCLRRRRARALTPTRTTPLAPLPFRAHMRDDGPEGIPSVPTGDHRSVPQQGGSMTDPTTASAPVALDPEALSFADVVAVARRGAQVTIPAEVRTAVAEAREAVDALATADRPVYGVSTGFGALAQRHIPYDLRTRLQKSLIRSHAAGVGTPVEPEVVRALMLLRARTLATGRTGVRTETFESYVALLNAGITPVVHEYGSLGCSGDLAPLSACALVLMGEGEVHGPPGADGTPTAAVPAADALAEAGIAPVELHEKEGLALVNG